MSALTRLTDPTNVHVTTANPLLQVALDNYHEMENQRDEALNRADSMNATNAALVAEIGVLRDQLERADAERIRLSAVASTLLGRLMAIHDTIAGAVKAATREGIEAGKTEPEQTHAEAQDVIQRVFASPGPMTSVGPGVAVRAPEAAGAAIGSIPSVDWSRPQQG